MITGKLGYNPKTKRYGLLVTDLWEHTGLHCGEKLESRSMARGSGRAWS